MGNKLIAAAFVLLLIIAIPLLLLSNNANKKAEQSAGESMIPENLTTDNTDATLSSVDSDMQFTLNQVDTDLQSVNSIDTSQDSTSGL